MIAALESYLEALRGGTCPRRGHEFLAQHAEIAEALGQCLSGLEFIQRRPSSSRRSQLVTAGSIRPTTCPPCAQLGDYRILREVGRGGMGVVYEAEQVSLGRRVALKVLPFAAAIDPKQRQRFQIEAQAAAQLHHPHIVPIFGVGCDQGIHYYAMQFVEGRSLAAVLHELRHRHGIARSGWRLAIRPVDSNDTEEALVFGAPTVRIRTGARRDSIPPRHPVRLVHSRLEHGPVPAEPLAPAMASLRRRAVGPMHQDRAFCRNVARLGAEAADALDHAHGLGILHRDIKPANLLIDRRGRALDHRFRPGAISRRTQPDAHRRHGRDAALHEPRAGPGPARSRRPADRHLFAGRDPLRALDPPARLRRPRPPGAAPPDRARRAGPPRRLNPAVPRDLETIVLKAMAKEPAEPLHDGARNWPPICRRFLDDRPILAHRPNPVELSLRLGTSPWRLVATTTAIVVLALIVSTAAIWAQARKTQTALHALEDANRRHRAWIIEFFRAANSVVDGVHGANEHAHERPANPGRSGRDHQGLSAGTERLRSCHQSSAR